MELVTVSNGFRLRSMSRFGPDGSTTPIRMAACATAENIMDLYFNSVGHGASLLLNLPPDRRGLIHENDVAVAADISPSL